MTALVTKHLPLVSGAPDGIKKLRALILELAARGKLVPHDPSDEPIAALLTRTAAAKAALQPRGRVKAKKSPNDLAGGYPYVIPSGWKWCSLADLVEVLNGRAYKKEELLEQGTPVLRVGNLFTSKHWYYSDLILDEDRYCVPGDLLYAWSASFGPFIWTGERSIYHYHIWKLAPHSDADLSRRYLHDYLQAQTAAIKAAGHGVSMTHMTKEKMEQLPVPLPPLAEQHRIVAKVDELMALCDRLEADQADAEAAHAQLVQALLDSLTRATDAADFRASWQRLSEHFHTLFTTEASIDALKQTVLQLAVMGKLAHQDSADSPANLFLLQNKISADEHPSLDGWAVIGLGQLGRVIGGATPSKANASYWVGDIPWVSPKDMKRAVIDDAEDHVSKDALDGSPLKAVPSGSLLMVVRGMILAHSFPVAITTRTVTINQDMKALVPPSEIASYLLMFLQASKSAMVALVDRSSHGTCKLISEKLWGYPVALPPLAEQHRIVAKVDELMALCDQLKAQLSAARQQHAQLATVLVEQAVA